MNILILGSAEDAHAAWIEKALLKTGATVNYLDTRLFPSQLQLSWQPDSQVGSITLPDGSQFSFTEIQSIFWRQLGAVSIPHLGDPHQQRIALNDSMSALRSLLQALPVRWINSWQAYEFHREKPLQLRAVKQLGATIPETLISNDPQQVTAFARSQLQTIFKPVYGGAHTQFVTEDHLQPERLKAALRLSPIAIQEYIPGTNIRSYAIADSVYSAEIRSPALDFRADIEAELIPIELPEAVKQQCLAIAKTLKLAWTGIDWRLTPTGDYIFLEANPSPMFIHFERKTGFPITQQLVKLLID